MNSFKIDYVEHKNAGIAREWALCRHYGISRTSHDHSAYDEASDIEVNGMGISVKASAFTLMSGSLCEGRDTFDGIWELYAERVHSDHFAYITADYIVYMMNLSEFKQFVYRFCSTEKESEKNGGQTKIRCHKESQKMVAWLNSQVA